MSQQSGQPWTENTALFSGRCGGDAAPDQRSAGFSFRWRRSGTPFFSITLRGMTVLNAAYKSMKDIKMHVHEGENHMEGGDNGVEQLG